MPGDLGSIGDRAREPPTDKTEIGELEGCAVQNGVALCTVIELFILPFSSTFVSKLL